MLTKFRYKKLFMALTISVPLVFCVEYYWQNHRIDLISLVSSVEAGIEKKVATVSHGQKNIQELSAENSRLKSYVLELQAKINLLAEDARENKALKELLGATSKLEGSFVAAKLVKWVSFESKTAIINKGAKDMVFLGQAVLDGYGIFAQVVEVGSDSSKVRLITSDASAVPIKDKANFRGFARGNNNGLVIKDVPDTTNFHSGDLIFASGIGGVYPKGYPYARVNKVKLDNNGNQLVELTPVARITQSDYLLLYWPDRAVKPPFRL